MTSPDDWREQAASRALDYFQPARPQLEIGRLVTAESDDGGERGFDPGAGCYTLEPEGGMVRFVIDGTRQPRYSPAFRILSSVHDDHEGKVWVYVDQRLHEAVSRLGDGSVLFQLDGAIRHRVLVEVLFAEAVSYQPSAGRKR